ncbi:hypothetical protein ASD07_14250 [Duganella sp. Root336D2]|nr:hypothetical protein ASD07_14250 [Duganella sp. Root336D2]
MPAEIISYYNRTWGICGFTSALSHLYSSDVRLRSRVHSKTSQEIQLALLVEVMTFLKYVRAFRTELIPGLVALNKELNSDLMKLGVEGFLSAADRAVRAQIFIDRSNEFQCAMTPEALTLYVQVICGIPTATLTSNADPGGQGILGIMNSKNELVHWVYRDGGGNVYNWGMVMSPLTWPTDKACGLGNKALDQVGCHVSLA